LAKARQGTTTEQSLLVRMRWKMNADFVGVRAGNNLVSLGSQDFTFGKAIVIGFLNIFPRGGTYPPESFHMTFYNRGNLDNSHACSNAFGMTCYPNVKDTPIYRDTWYTVETYVVSSTCLTCRNATVKWWVDGVLQGNYTNLNYGDGIINEWQINHLWDGTSTTQCGPPTNPSNAIGRDCRKDQYLYFDHVILAAVGAK